MAIWTPGSPLPEPLWTPSNREYHSTMDRWSSSMLKRFMTQPYSAWKRYVAQTEGGGPPTSSMVTGSIVNALLLDPDNSLNSLYVSNATRRTDQGFREAYDGFPETLVVTKKERDAAGPVADAILEPRTPAAQLGKALLMNGIGFPEWANTWDDVSGVACKQMIDRLTLMNGWPAIVELKTDKDPFKFRWTAKNWRYHDQAVFNIRGVKSALGVEPKFYWVVVRNAPDYEVVVYMLRDDKKLEAEADVNDGLTRLNLALADETGATWARPDELLEDDEIPRI